MYEELLEKNKKFIQELTQYRSYETEIKTIIQTLNAEKIITISGLSYCGKTQVIHSLLKKTKSFNSTFYFNAFLDSYKSIKNREDMTILFDLYVRVHDIPKIIVLQNTHKIEGIVSFITDLYKTKKYKIILIWNTLSIEWSKKMEIFPQWIDVHSYIWSSISGIPAVRVIPNIKLKQTVLHSIRNDTLLHEVIQLYTIKNTHALIGVLSYLAQLEEYQSLREIHRNINQRWLDISLLTMIDYINAVLKAKILSRVYLYDIKNTNTIESKAVYYFWDVWLRSSFDSEFHPIENLLYLELKMRHYNISWGINGRFQFALRAQKWNNILSIAVDQSWEKNEIRKIARKLEKIWDASRKYVIVENKNSLGMRKFMEGSVEILEITDFLRK